MRIPFIFFKFFQSKRIILKKKRIIKLLSSRYDLDTDNTRRLFFTHYLNHGL